MSYPRSFSVRTSLTVLVASAVVPEKLNSQLGRAVEGGKSAAQLGGLRGCLRSLMPGLGVPRWYRRV